MRRIIDREVSTKFGLDPSREETDIYGNIVLKVETHWADCIIYVDMKDAASCMERHIPLLYSELITHIIKELRDWQLHGFGKFYQVVLYNGPFGKFDNRNCYSLCTLCKKPLLDSIGEKGDAPIPLVVPLKSYIDPVVVFVLCFTCATRKYSENPENLARRELFRIILSKESRWIKNNRLIESPISDDK